MKTLARRNAGTWLLSKALKVASCEPSIYKQLLSKTRQKWLKYELKMCTKEIRFQEKYDSMVVQTNVNECLATFDHVPMACNLHYWFNQPQPVQHSNICLKSTKQSITSHYDKSRICHRNAKGRPSTDQTVHRLSLPRLSWYQFLKPQHKCKGEIAD